MFRLLSDATIDIDIVQERLEIDVDNVIEKQEPRKLEFRQRDKVEGYVFHVSRMSACGPVCYVRLTLKFLLRTP